MACQAPFAEGDLSRARQLLEAVPDPKQPYSHLYAAADALGELAERADAGGAERCAARLRVEQGLALLRTDLLSQGEPLLSAALQGPAGPGLPPLDALRARNALAALWCDRGEEGRALDHLRAAQQAYERASGGGDCGAARGAATGAADKAAREAVAAGGGAAPPLAPEEVGRLSLESAGRPSPCSTESGAPCSPPGAEVGPAGAAAPEPRRGCSGAPAQEQEDAWLAPLRPADEAAALEDAYTQTRAHRQRPARRRRPRGRRAARRAPRRPRPAAPRRAPLATGAAAAVTALPPCRPAQSTRTTSPAVYFLAQVHGLVGDKAASAAYCAATLNRQAARPGAPRARGAAP
jgi:hypothetical protein